jgi:hypothetical protein
MLGFRPKLPVSEDERCWVDEGFRRLEKMLGRRRLLEAMVVMPTAEHFPDPYDKTPTAAEKLFCRVCTYMQVERSAIELEIFPDETEELSKILPSWRAKDGKRAAGLFVHDKGDHSPAEHQCDQRDMVVAIRSTLLQDPLSLVATVAHELGHVILLGGGLMSRETEDHEPLTDLLTVYFGLGIFTANSAARFRKYQDERRQGWSTQRLGYLPEAVFGYALAKFCLERGEEKPEWARHLSPNVRADFKRSRTWLAENPHYVATAKPIG